MLCVMALRVVTRHPILGLDDAKAALLYADEVAFNWNPVSTSGLTDDFLGNWAPDWTAANLIGVREDWGVWERVAKQMKENLVERGRSNGLGPPSLGAGWRDTPRRIQAIEELGLAGRVGAVTVSRIPEDQFAALVATASYDQASGEVGWGAELEL